MKLIGEVIKERKFKYICLFWFIIGLQFVAGGKLQTEGYLFNDGLEILINILKIIVISIIFIILHYSILEVLKKIKKTEKKEEIENKKYKWLKYFLIIFICWIPTVLAFYPGILGYDGGDQIGKYFFGNRIPHHPILTTKIYTAFYYIGMLIESPTIGIFLFSITQMIFMASVFSYTVKFIEEHTQKKWIRNISILFYALYPYNQLFAITTTKDVIFSGLMLVFAIFLYKMMKEKYRISDYIFFIIIGVIMLLSRNNAVYTLKVSLPLIIIVLIKDKYKIFKVLITFILIIIIYQNANNFLYKTLNRENSNSVSIIGGNSNTNQKSDEKSLRVSIFAQAVGKVARDKKEVLTQKEKEGISLYFKDYEKLGEKYKENISDSASSMANGSNINKDKKEFFKFIIELGRKYPITYIESFLNTTRGYWYIGDISFSRIYLYNHPGAFELYEYRIAPGKFEVIYDSKLPKLKETYIEMFCKNKYQQIPILYILFQPGIYFYITLAFFLYTIYKKEKDKIVISIFLCTFFASCYLVACSIVRYIYPIIVSTPLMIALMLDRKEEEK